MFYVSFMPPCLAEPVDSAWSHFLKGEYRKAISEIIQSGNRCQKAFFNDRDKRTYIDFLSKHAIKAGVTFWAYC